ncbi:MAG: chemotaxis-specific protein-glutamate methyltransferase CheB [Thermoanaerobaculaceae bacterium]|jgi:two-component system chemotaxis response regulator CheB
MRKIRVLVVDDAAVVRRLVSEALAGDPAIEIAGVAPTGRLALAKLPHLSPDLVTLDVEMPGMSGLETLAEIRTYYPDLPVIMLSAHTEQGAAITLEALSLGASDYLPKPAGLSNLEETREYLREQLIPKVKALCAGRVGHAVSALVAQPAPEGTRRAAVQPRADRLEIVGIGVSTGGPNALATLLSGVARDFPLPIVVVQHMPPVFTRLLAERLSDSTPLKVREAVPGGVLEPGVVWLARGDYHLVVEREGKRLSVNINQEPRENSCRPSVDVLFRSLARVFGGRSLAVVLTGMGRDGLQGCQEIRDVGGQVVVQDEATSVVWGMPGFVANAGLAHAIVPLGLVAGEMERRAWARRSRAMAAMSAGGGRAISGE